MKKHSSAQQPFDKFRGGYITLLSVLIIGSIGIAIIVSMLFLGTGFSRSSLLLEQSAQAKALVNACGEEALQQIRDVTAYTGTATLVLGQGACTYTVTSLGGQEREIVVSSTVGTVIRKGEITLSKITPTISISSWQELADF